MITQKYITDLTYRINGDCIEVHKILGAGLAEIVYHKKYLSFWSGNIYQ